MDFLILGPLEVREQDRVVSLGGTRQRALLAILLTRANQVVSKSRLIDELWGEEPPETAANVLQVYVSRLRKVLPPELLLTRSPGYVLRLDPAQLDLHRFERLVEQAGETLAAGVAEAAASTLREALALWRGPAFADFVERPFARAEAARLDELRLTALERRIEADLALGRHGELVGELKALIDEHPLRERLRGQLMLALYRSGRQAEALDVYRETRRRLVGELGIEPGPALHELEQAILRQDPALAVAGGTRVPERSILVVPRAEGGLDALLAFAGPLAVRPARELILAMVVAAPGDLARASAALGERREALIERGLAARVAAFT